jgi:hypothetical protein
MIRRVWRLGVFGLVAFVLAAAAPPADAQTISGIIAGTVADQQANRLPAVSIIVTNPATGRQYTTSTDDNGYFRIPEVSPGVYTVRAELAGFQTTEHTNVRVSVNRVTLEEFVLEIPPRTEVVEVQSEAPLTDTTSPTLGNSFDDRQVRELPILTRDINNLALLAPGVQSVRTFSFGSTLVPFSANGSRGRDNNFIIDSVDNNEPLFGGAATQFTNTDIFTEYTILTNQLKAEFGRNSGATVNVITKQGSNVTHGSLFWFGQHDAFNARSRVEQISLLRSPVSFNENAFGGTLGGALKKDKTFYFLSYQWDRAQTNLTNVFPVLGTLPADAAALATLQGLAAGRPALQTYLSFPSVTQVPLIPFACFEDPAPSGFTTTNPCLLTNTAVGANSIPFNVFLMPNGNLFAIRDHQASARIDHRISNTQDFYARYLFDDLKTPRVPVAPTGDAAFADLGLLPEWRLVAQSRAQSLLLNHRYYWPSALNELRFAFSRVAQNIGAFGVDRNTREGLAAATVGDDFGGFGIFQANFGAAGRAFTLGRDSKPSEAASSTFQVQDNLSYNRGRHSMKAGLNFVRIRTNLRTNPSDLGQYFFGAFGSPGGFDDFINEPTACTFCTNAILVLQRFPNVLSDPVSGAITGQGTDRLHLREFDQFYFFQDDFRARPNLTFSFGIRFEHYGQPSNRIAEQNPAAQRVDSDSNNFAPRFGFSWSPWKRTVIRGGYAVMYNPMVLNIPLLVWQSGPVSPFVATDAVGLSLAQPRGTFPGQPLALFDIDVSVFGCSNFFDRADTGSVPLLRCSSSNTINRNLVNPYVQNWTFGFQRELTPNLLAEVNYVFTKGTKLYQRVDLNPLGGWDITNAAHALGMSFGTIDCTVLPSSGIGAGCYNARLDNARGAITQVTNGGRSTYHALQVSLNKRMTRTRVGDFAFTGAYTWSHLIDNVSEIFGPGVRFLPASDPLNLIFEPEVLELVESITPLSADPLNLAAERASSSFDRRHRLAISYLWDPWPTRGFWAGGWQLNGLVALQSGQPFSPLNSTPLGPCRDYNGDGRLTNDRPAIGNPNAPANTVALLVDPNCIDPTLGYVDAAGNAVNPVNVRYVQVPRGLQPGQVFSDGTTTFVAGSAGRNSLTGPGIINFDLAIFKNFRWNEGKRNIQFRWEIYDLFNTANPGNAIGNVFSTDAQPTPAFAFNPRRTAAGVTGVIPENAIDAVDFITGAPSFLSRAFMNTSSRRMQFGVKFIF